MEGASETTHVGAAADRIPNLLAIHHSQFPQAAFPFFLQTGVLLRTHVSASLKRIHFRRFGVGYLAQRRVWNTRVRWLLRWREQS